MKLKNLTEKQVVQTTKENHEAFMKLLDKEGFKWNSGDSYIDEKYTLNRFYKGHVYNVKNGTVCTNAKYLTENEEVISASKFLKPTKKELLERIEKLEEVVNKTIEVKPTNLKIGDLCAFADDENDFNSKELVIRELEEIKESNIFKYIDFNGTEWKYARKVEIKFL